MEPVEIRDMLYILAICEERSFSRTAEKYYISQPALSKIVKRVEGNLGAQIFDRGVVPLRITPDGELFIEYFRRMEEIQREIETQCDEMRQNRRFDLNIGAPSFFCTYVLPPLAAAFKAEYPGASIKLIETNDSDLRQFLRAKVVDLGLSVEPSMPVHIDSFVLKKETIILAVPGSLEINRKLESFIIRYEDILTGRFHGELAPIPMNYETAVQRAGIDLTVLERAFQDGVKLFLFSNPNNPVGCVYSYAEIFKIAELARCYHVTLIVDELYSRQIYPGYPYTHLCALREIPDNLITIMGPSKTESLSGYRQFFFC